jgi:ParB family chromosome partitioning protein
MTTTTATAPAPQTEQRRETIALSKIQPSPTNPRKHFDKKTLEELADSIKSVGVLQDIVVREKGSAGFEVVFGERRYRAAKIAGLKEIMCVVRDLTDTQVLEAQIVENLQRADVEVIDEAFGFKALLESPGSKYTVESIALKVGKSTSHVYQRLKLTELIADAADAVQSGKISPVCAVDIARLQPEEQKLAVEFCLYQRDYSGRPTKTERKEPASVREVRQWIHDNVQLDLKKAPFDTTDAKLVPTAGACTNCTKNTSNQIALFEGSGIGKATCTDPTCYQQKKLALVNISVEKIAKKNDGEAPLMISTSYSPGHGERPMKGVTYTAKYEAHGYDEDDKYGPIQKGSCPDTKLAIVVDSTKDEDLGKTKYVCVAEKCKIHTYKAGDSVGGSSSSASDERKKAKLKRDYAIELTRQLGAKLVTGKEKLKREDLIMAAELIFERCGFPGPKNLAVAMEWKDSEEIYSKLKECSEQQLVGYIVLLAASHDLISTNYGTPVHLQAVAKRHKINATKILQSVKDAAREKKNAATAKTPKVEKPKAEKKPKAKKKAKASKKKKGGR